MNTKRFRRYHDALRNMPPSGGGGCHRALLSVANLGRLASVSRDEVAQDLAENVHGARKVTVAEVTAAVNKAFNVSSTVLHGRTVAATPRPRVDGVRLLDSILKRSNGFYEADLWEVSPVRVDWPPERDAIEVLRLLYRPENRLFIGARHDAGAGHVLPVWEWMTRFEHGTAPEHIAPNPMTGDPGQTKDGRPSYRADSCVAGFRFAVVEFDTLTRDRQMQFWAGAPLPVVALIDSGGKSIHGWIKIDAANTDEWSRRAEGKLFGILTAVGADGACKNESRLSRMPGHFRAEKGRWQRLLYLNPDGGPVLP